MSLRDIYGQMAGLFPVDRDQIIAEVKSRQLDLREHPPSSIALAEVRTYVHDMKTSPWAGEPGVTVPSFACHWGVVVNDTLYHLVFQDAADANSDLKNFAREGRPIVFGHINPAAKVIVGPGKVAGTTKYRSTELEDIGKALIDAFGNYHRLFWNCQVFADCFLYLITGEKRFEE